jgi:long-chain fatty acid transport protein
MYLCDRLTKKDKLMRKLTLIGTALLIAISCRAGGLLTNTNQHISFLRMVARGASLQIDGVYSNPAGTAFLSNGFYVSLNGQSAYQTRNIDATFSLFPEGTRQYKGTASAPLIPSVFFAYKHDSWALSGSFAVVGGGGKASFDTGLPMFDSRIMAGIYSASKGTITPSMYTINSSMSGKQLIYGAQLGLSYQIDKHLSGFLGGRMNYFSGNYRGYAIATLNSTTTTLTDVELDCDQTGWGITPIIGLDYKYGKWNVGLKYEFKTNLNIQNTTKKNSDPEGTLKDYKDGVNTPNDIPSLLSAAVSYQFTPRVRATVEYHFYDDKHASMANISGTTTGKQHALTHGTNEFLAGGEWDATKFITLSAGIQRTDYGLSNDYQTDTSFACDSYSIGLGGALKLSPKLTMNVAYFWTNYSKYTKSTEASSSRGYNDTTLAGTDVYSRTNKVFGVGFDYKF